MFAGRLDAAAEAVGDLVLSFANRDGDFRLDVQPATGLPKSFFDRLFGRQSNAPLADRRVGRDFREQASCTLT